MYHRVVTPVGDLLPELNGSPRDHGPSHLLPFTYPLLNPDLYGGKISDLDR